MQLVNEKNIASIIAYTFVLIVAVLLFFVSYMYVTHTRDNFEREMQKYADEYYANQKNILVQKVQLLEDIVQFHASELEHNKSLAKKSAIQVLSAISFDKQRSDYIFVYEVHNFAGGDDFATLRVHANRPDIINHLISTNYEDAKGFRFREKFLADIVQEGQSFTSYAYSKVSSEGTFDKLSYFKLYPKWNWIIASGVYIADIEQDILYKRASLQKSIRDQLIQTGIIFLAFLLVSIPLVMIFFQRIDDFFQEYRLAVKTKEKDLLKLNKNLSKQVKAEVKKNREMDQVLIEKSRFVALGKLTSHIAHQWRQPLSELSSLFMAISFRFERDKLTKEYMQQKTTEIEKVLGYMSSTIDDFRSFFRIKKEKQHIALAQTIQSVLSIIGSTLRDSQITVHIDIDETIIINTYINEYEHVILNILSNAKDELVRAQITEPYIKIYAKQETKKTHLYIKDNAGGITASPITKIFEPFFTTKDVASGTGIGLYMCRTIIEKNMKGVLSAYNEGEGAVFEIVTDTF